MNTNLSAVVITKNEAADIANCLTALSQVTNDIVVVDSFSTDMTPEICQGFQHVTFIQQAWAGYSEQKNAGIRLTRNPFVISVDGDEVLSKKLIESIKNEMIDPQHEAYSFKMIPYFCGSPIRHAGQNTRKTRIWLKELGKWEGLLHEQIAFNKKVRVQPLKGVAEHYTIPSEASFREKIKNYSALFAEQKYGVKQKPSMIRLFVGPAYTFVRMYFLQAGFLDGMPGFRFCYLMATLNHAKYAALRKKYIEKAGS